MSRFTRSIPALGAAAALGIGGAGATALANGDHHHEGDRGHHKGQHKYSAYDEQYLQNSIEGDLFEIQGGKLAEQQGSTQAVKDYGKRLVDDHTKSLGEATALAKKLGIDVPKAPTPQEQGILTITARLSGAQFDQAYVDVERMDHQQDISEAQDEVKKGTNRELRKDAAKEIPTLKEHLKIATDLGGHEATEPLPQG